MAVYLGSQKVDVSGVMRVEVGDITPYIINYANMFNNAKLPDDFELLINISETYTNIDFSQMMFHASGVKKVIMRRNNSEQLSVNWYRILSNCTTIETLDFSNINIVVTGLLSGFEKATKLREIIGCITLDPSCKSTSCFGGTTMLETITFTSQTIAQTISFSGSSRLSSVSIQSIIDGLADLTGATSQKISFHSTVLNKLTDEQLEQILAKNWTI